MSSLVGSRLSLSRCCLALEAEEPFEGAWKQLPSAAAGHQLNERLINGVKTETTRQKRGDCNDLSLMWHQLWPWPFHVDHLSAMTPPVLSGAVSQWTVFFFSSFSFLITSAFRIPLEQSYYQRHMIHIIIVIPLYLVQDWNTNRGIPTNALWEVNMPNTTHKI